VSQYAMHVHVDEPGHDGVAVERDPGLGRRRQPRPAQQVDDAIAFDDDGQTVGEAVGEHDARAGQQRDAGAHAPRASTIASMVSITFRPRSGRSVASAARKIVRST